MKFVATLLFTCICVLNLASATESAGFYQKGSTVRAAKRRLDRKANKGKVGKTNGTKMPSTMPSIDPTAILPTDSPRTSASQPPSISSAPSWAPSLSGIPSDLPSLVPSVGPSVSNKPSTSQVPSLTPSKSMEPTCIDSSAKEGKGGKGKAGKGKHHICDSASPSQAPSMSRAPSTSSQPSTSPSMSNAPSMSKEPSLLPSFAPSSAPTCGKGKGSCPKAPPKKNRNNPDGETPLASDTRSAEVSSAAMEYSFASFGNSIASMMLLVGLFALALWD